MQDTEYTTDLTDMDIQQLIGFLGGTTAITALLAYLGKKAIEGFLSAKLESHKKNLERIAAEHTIRFQHLHSERAEVVKSLYQKLVLLDESLHSTLRRFQAVGEPSLVEKVNELGDRFNTFREFYLPNKIFLEENLCGTIDAILEAAKGVFFDITTYDVDTTNLSDRYHSETLRERRDFWDQARNVHENEILTLKVRLENNFRIILGINN